MRPSRVLALGMIAAAALGALALGACGRMLEIQPDPFDAAATSDGSSDGPSSDGQSSNDAGPDGPGCTNFGSTGKVVFVSEPWTPGGDLAAADVACKTSAAHAGYCQRTFVAFVGTSTALPHRRLPQAGGPWVRPLGGVVFDSVPQMEVMDVVPKTPVDQLADGGHVDVNTTVWTGAHAKLGLPNLPDQTCNDWKSAAPTAFGIVGTPAMATAEWIEKQGSGGTPACNVARPVLCFEQ